MKSQIKFAIFCKSACLLGGLVLSLACNAQKNTEVSKETLDRERLIAASQAGALPLFFEPSAPGTSVITPGTFSDPNDFFVRKGLPNFFQKAKKKEPLVVAYIGGSITRGINLYRMQSAKFIQDMYPNTKMQFINAGISGTGTDLGACRIQEQVLQYKPDLVFVEFAVNNAFAEGMEGIIRQIWKANPSTDICLLYTIYSEQTKTYASGKIPPNILGLEKLADYYQIPSVHMGLEASMLEKEDKLLWKAPAGTKTDKIIFSNDGTHPVEAGGNLYAQAIARSFVKMQDYAENKKHELPKPFLPDNWEEAKMLAPSVAQFSKGWTKIDPNALADFKQFAGWFPYVMKAEKPGEYFTFKFKGNMIGFFDIGGPEVGQFTLEIDGKKATINKQAGTLVRKTQIENNSENLINRFNSYCNNRYRGQAEFFELSPGVHTVKFIISDEIADKKQILGESQSADITANPAKYNKTVAYIGKILIKGEILPAN